MHRGYRRKSLVGTLSPDFDFIRASQHRYSTHPGTATSSYSVAHNSFLHPHMDRWAPIAPRRIAPIISTLTKDNGASAHDPDDEVPSIRGLSRRVMLRILDFVPVSDLTSVALASRECWNLVCQEKLWKWRWDRIHWQKMESLPDALLDAPPEPIPMPATRTRKDPPPISGQPSAASSKVVDLLADLDWDPPATLSPTPKPYSRRVQRAYHVLRPFLRSFMNAPSTTSSWLFTKIPNVTDQCKFLCTLARFASEHVQGVPSPGLEDEVAVRAKLRLASMALSTQLRTAYEANEASYTDSASSSEALQAMKLYAALAWDLRLIDEVLGSTSTTTRPSLPHAAKLHDLGGNAVAQAFVSSRPILNERMPHSPHDVVDHQGVFHLRPLQKFAQHLERELTDECALIQAVFPAAQPVEIVFIERVVHEIVADYLANTLQEARNAPPEVYLQVFVQSLVEMQRLTCVSGISDPDTTKAVICHVWLQHMDEYVLLELAWQHQHLKDVCDRWLRDLDSMLQEASDAASPMPLTPHSAADKRSFMANFTRALLLPAVSREQTKQASSRASSFEAESTQGYAGLGHAPLGIGEENDDDDDDEWQAVSRQVNGHDHEHDDATSTSAHAQSVESQRRKSQSHRLSMSSLLNVETAVDMVNITRVSLQRLDLVRKTNSELRSRAQATIVQALVQLYASINDEHMTPGFRTAREQIGAYNPAQHDRTSSSGSIRHGQAADQVGPLLLFFELVHIGDTIQQMTQVFFERLDPDMLGKADFTNAAVREKRRFENDLDEHVAAGLSAGVELLVQQLEYIVLTHQNPRDFYPELEAYVDVSQPTAACVECCETMRTYCHLLATCADKALLDVFYQEIGFRLYSVLCKHLKRQIISTLGGVRVISDLNYYFHFIETLEQPSLLTLFGALKRVASLFIIDEPKELAKLVQDTTLSNGTMRPEEMYEFLRARCDFKTIESNVDAEMYGIKIREDCIVS